MWSLNTGGLLIQVVFRSGLNYMVYTFPCLSLECMEFFVKPSQILVMVNLTFPDCWTLSTFTSSGTKPPGMKPPQHETEMGRNLHHPKNCSQYTVMFLSFLTDRSGQTVLVQTQIRLSLIRDYTVCHSVCIFWTHYLW